MRREEAEVVAKEKAKLMIEYLEQFLSDEKIVNGIMEFTSDNSMAVVDVVLKSSGVKIFEKHLNLGFSSVYADLLTEEISRILLETFMPSDHFGVSDYARIRGMGSMDKDGFEVFNSRGSEIAIEFHSKNDRFNDIMRAHNQTIGAFRNEVKSKGL